MQKIILRDIKKSYLNKNNHDDNVSVLNGISFNISRGTFISIFGSNGCGKTTLLKILASIEKPDSGIIEYTEGWEKLKTKMMFQNYRSILFPWRKNIDNIAFPLELKEVPKKDRHNRVKELLEDLNIKIPLYQYPYQLSGGQQQMLVIARNLIDSPNILLCDEPYSALDYETKYNLQDKLNEIWSQKNITIIFVSHELDEAIYLSDRLLLLSKKPSKILLDFNINLPRPRKQNLKLSQNFFEIKRHIQAIFEKDLFDEEIK